MKNDDINYLQNLSKKYVFEDESLERKLLEPDELFFAINTLLNNENFDVLSLLSGVFWGENRFGPEDHERDIYHAFSMYLKSNFSKLNQKEIEKITGTYLYKIYESTLIDIWIDLWRHFKSKASEYKLTLLTIIDFFDRLTSVYDHQEGRIFSHSESAKIFFSTDITDEVRRKSWWWIFLDLPFLKDSSWVTFPERLMTDRHYLDKMRSMILSDEETECLLVKIRQIEIYPIHMPMKDGVPQYRKTPKKVAELIRNYVPRERIITR